MTEGRYLSLQHQALKAPPEQSLREEEGRRTIYPSGRVLILGPGTPEKQVYEMHF